MLKEQGTGNEISFFNTFQTLIFLKSIVFLFDFEQYY